MTRSVLAVIAGFLTMILLVIVTTFLASAVTGGGHSMSSTYLTLNLAGSGVAAYAGGRLAGFIALRRPLLHALALAALIIALSVPAIGNPPAGQPAWYPVTVAVLGVLGALAGGRSHARRAVTGASGAA